MRQKSNGLKQALREQESKRLDKIVSQFAWATAILAVAVFVSVI